MWRFYYCTKSVSLLSTQNGFLPKSNHPSVVIWLCFVTFTRSTASATYLVTTVSPMRRRYKPYVLYGWVPIPVSASWGAVKTTLRKKIPNRPIANGGPSQSGRCCPCFGRHGKCEVSSAQEHHRTLKRNEKPSSMAWVG